MNASRKSLRNLVLKVIPCVLQATRSYSLTPVNKAGVYLHIPFCRRRCHYCDFPIKVVGEKESTHRSSGQYYTEILVKDIEHWSRTNGAEGAAVDTVYFGGGTPSLLPDENIKTILDQLRKTYRIKDDAEVTLEMDPGTFTYERLLILREHGINRISMGVQSFDNAILKHCGRPHTVEDTYRALEDLHRANWENFSIDLISSLPHLTPELWQDTLQQAVSAGSSHISVYDLQIEPKTAFGRWYTPNESPLPCEITSTEMYGTAVRTLTTAGFEHYEVSNYARPGRRSRHNQKYWSLAPVYAFGMSAASYVQGERFSRPKSMKEYEQYVQDLTLASALSSQVVLPTYPGGNVNGNAAPPAGDSSASVSVGSNKDSGDTATTTATATATPLPDMLDVVMLSLRTADGLHLPHFEDAYGAAAAEKVVKVLAPFAARGLVEFKTSGGLAIDYGHKQQCGVATDSSSDAKRRTTSVNIDKSNDMNKLNDHTEAAGIGVNCTKDSTLSGSVRLTDPEGFLLSNDVISSVFAALD